MTIDFSMFCAWNGKNDLSDPNGQQIESLHGRFCYHTWSEPYGPLPSFRLMSNDDTLRDKFD